MALVNLPYTLQNGAPNDVDLVMANYNAITAALNGNVDTENIADAVLEDVGVSDASAVRRGKQITSASESTNSTSYTLLVTPDRVQNVVLPTDGLIVVAYKALMTVTGAGAGSAALFLGTSQVKLGGAGAPAVQEAQITGTTNAGHLSTSGLGLTAMANTGAASTDVTTGQIVGVGVAGGGAGGRADGGLTVIEAAAGTYDVSVRFKVSVGTTSVAVSSRKLRVWTIGF